MKSNTIKLWVLCFLLLQACSSRTVETITVDRQADTPTPPEEIEEADTEVSDSVLRIGEINKITGFDPLFALNPASQRVIQLVYEGLIALDDQDEIQPAIATDWEISDDSLVYTFHLNRSAYFHNDQSFGSGIGRRVRASDFKQAFERMTSRDVPPNAAELFVDYIMGFEAYFYEQREIYRPEEKTLEEVNGIQVINDSTLTFTLIEPDPGFLHKLASPYAVVYPQEALRNRSGSLRNHPVGTGPFMFGSSSGDTLHVLTRNSDYHSTGDNDQPVPRLERVEILNHQDETHIFRHLVLGRIDIIMEMGPQMIRTLVNSDNELETSYREQFKLGVINHEDPYIIQYNPNNRYGLGAGHASTLVNTLSFESLRSDVGNPSLQVIYQANDQENGSYINDLRNIFSQSEGNQRLIFSFSSDESTKILSAHIINMFNDQFNAALMEQRVSSRNIFLKLEQPIRYTPNGLVNPLPQEVLRIEKDRYYLARFDIEDTSFNSYSWWLNLNNIQLPEESL